MVYLEIKKKLMGIVYKRRISMRLAQVDTYMQSEKERKFDNRLDQQISNEIFLAQTERDDYP